MDSITLPRASDSRAAAEMIVRRSHILAFTDELRLVADEVESVTTDFTDELMHQLFESGVLQVCVVGASDEVFRLLETSSRFGTHVVRALPDAQ
ncbi:hypothetical protein ACFC3F_09140 [Microbacterium sp. NPDC055910]|uniref:hypothetical protein n=1 Tax=Microbacterium sp. NPDC055910 TaxID=3345659 RepID=UPI0035E33260